MTSNRPTPLDRLMDLVNDEFLDEAAELRKVLQKELADLREENVFQRQDIEDLTNQRDDLQAEACKFPRGLPGADDAGGPNG